MNIFLKDQTIWKQRVQVLLIYLFLNIIPLSLALCFKWRAYLNDLLNIKCWSSGINEHFCYIYWKRFLFVGSTDTIDLRRYRISPIHLIATAVIAFMTTGFSTVMPTYAGAVAFTASSYYRNVERGDSDDEWGIVGDLYHFFPHDADPAADLENKAPSSAVRYRKPVFFPFHLYLFALAERERFIIFCHAMCMIEELCYITQNWTETIK